MNFLTATCGVAILSSVGIVTPGVALAQNTARENEYDEIIVTAERRSESIIDVPISLTVFTAEEISVQNIQSLDDYFDITPNIAFENNGNPLLNDVAIRGISNIGGEQNVIGFYLDEFNVAPLAVSSTLDQRLVDVERIEVLRGPQGTLYGRNATGGAISTISTKPDVDAVGGYISAEYANFDTFEAAGAVNFPLSQVLAVRMNGFFETSGGFLKNEIDGGVTNDFDSFGFRGSLRYTGIENLTLDMSLSYQEFKQGANNAVPTGAPSDAFVSIGLPIVPPDAGVFPQNRDTIQVDQPLETTSNTTLFTTRFQYDLESFSIVGVGGYINNTNTLVGDSDLSGFNYYNDDNRNSVESWSTELRFQSNSDAAWNWLVGGIYAEDKTNDREIRTFEPDFLIDIFGVPPQFIPDFPVRPDNDIERGTVTSYGLFGELGWTDPSKKIDLSVGLRWQHDDVFTLFSAERNALSPGFPLVPQPVQSGKASFDEFLPRFSASYSFSSDLSAYVTVAKGSKPGGFNLGSLSFPAAPSTFDSESLWNYEAGLKGRTMDGSFSFGLAVFYIDWSDIQVSSVVFDPITFASTIVTQNATEATSSGFEFEAAFKPFDGFVLEGGLGYNDAEFEDFPNAIIDNSGNTADASGNTVPFAPKWSLNGSVEYKTAVTEEVEGFVRLEYIYRDSLFTDNESRSVFPDFVSSYNYLNFRAGAFVGNVRVIGYIENLTNEAYTTGINGGNSFSGVQATVNPRRYGVNVRYSF